MYDLVVVGGGAAGVFAAITAKTVDPRARVALLEKSAVLLSKVRISGGGRCNVTHSCFDPRLLVKNYPRGEKELLGPFHRFQPEQTIEWFASRGVKLKREADGRMFPTTDSSETIIQCLLSEAHRLGVEFHLRQKIEEIRKSDQTFELTQEKGPPFCCKRLLLATGSSPAGHAWAQNFGHTLKSPVPSLFTFNVPDSPLKELSGIAVNPAKVSLKGTPFSYEGPLLITHFGFSGPAALKLSAWGARFLAERNYQVDLLIHWVPSLSLAELQRQLRELKKEIPQKVLSSENRFNLPKSLWRALTPDQRLADVSLKDLDLLAQKLHADSYTVNGKTTHKEEFVTCGGVTLKEIDFKTLESKVTPGLFFAGEILDIDGITGGFNFQNAWTTGFIAGSSIFKT